MYPLDRSPPACGTANQESSESTMQNTKIQTLWNLCNELKEKRQFLVERLKHTQDYLDEQQWNLSREMHGLRQQTNSLADDVSTLSSAVESIYSLWQSQPGPTSPEAEAVEFPDFQPLLDAANTQQELAQGFADQAAALALLAGEINLPGSPELFQEGFQELQSEFTQHYGAFKAAQQYFGSLQSEALSQGQSTLPDFTELNASLSASAEFLASFSADAEGFQTQWQASKPYREAAPSASHEDSAPAELAALQAQLEAREKLLSETYTQAYASAVALAELQGQHDDLAGEMEHLMGVLANFQEILNQRPHVDAGVEGGAVAVAVSAASPENDDDESDESDETPESDRQVIREAVQESVRKRIAQVLKKRFTKVPRRVSNLLKKIEVSSRLDKLFELALECDSMEAFSSQLEESAG
jgi:hypothetical protein